MSGARNYFNIPNMLSSFYGKVKNSVNTVLNVLPFYKPQQKSDLIKMGAIAGITLTEIGLNVAIPVVIKQIGDTTKSDGDAETSVNYQYQFTLLLLGYGAGWAISNLSFCARRLLMSNLGDHAARRFQVSTQRMISELSFMERSRVKDPEAIGMINRASNSTNQLGSLLFGQLLPKMGELAFVSVAVAQQYNAFYSVGIFSVMTATTAYNLMTADLKQSAENKFQALQKATDAKTQSLISNYQTIHIYQNWENELTEYDKLINDTTNANLKRNSLYEVNTSGQTIILGMALSLGLSQMVNDHLTTQEFNALNLYMLKIAETLIHLGYNITGIRQSISNLDESMNIIRNEHPVSSAFFDSRTHNKTITKSSLILPHLSVLATFTDIQFENVNFSYTREKSVLKNLSFRLMPGITSLVGGSGSGKTSISRLLFRWVEPNAGEILINGISTKQFDVAGFRHKVGLVTQTGTLVGNTLYHSLTYGNPTISRNQVYDLVNRFNLEDFVRDLPQGYDTPVNDIEASGGQLQRISIIRTLLTEDKDLLIFDEPTSALDPSNKRHVVESMQALADKGKMVLLISHDPDLVQQYSDRVLVLESGAITQVGTPAELSQQDGFYRDEFIQPEIEPINHTIRFT